jgi:uncharacterized protein YgbK (DUF1537 family)
MTDVAIIADDLTGACDTGVKLTNLGYTTEVIINSDDCSSTTKSKRHIFSVNTDTRSVEPEEAYSRVRKAVESLKKNGIRLFYKKIDSVLRGNIGREIDAIFDVTDYELAIIAPALPDNGRVLKNGLLYELSEFSQKGISRLTAKEAICSTTARSCGAINLPIIRQGTQAIKDDIERLYSEGKTIIIADAETNQDLELISKAICESEMKILPVGSAGLISFLWPRRYTSTADRQNIRTLIGDNARVLVVAGSIHPATVAQIQQLNKVMSIYTFDIKGITLQNSKKRVVGLINRVMEDYQSKSEAFGMPVTTKQILNGDYSESKHETSRDLSNQAIADSLAQIAKRLIAELNINCLIATGGDTASSVFNKVGIKQIELVEELMPGIVAGIASRDSGEGLLVATKSGGFGDKTALERLVDYIYPTKVLY